MRVLLALFMIFVSLAPVCAVNPDEVLSDPALEARARALSGTLRCLVCQNQSIDDSDASLARDLRILVRERLEKGDTDKEAVDYIVARYGEFVLLKPRFAGHTLLLWISPFVLFLIGATVLFIRHRNRPRQESAAGEALSAEEETALRDLLRDAGEKS